MVLHDNYLVRNYKFEFHVQLVHADTLELALLTFIPTFSPYQRSSQPSNGIRYQAVPACLRYSGAKEAVFETCKNSTSLPLLQVSRLH
jgi:hypothetical protein